MCRSMVGIQSAAAEIRRRKKEVERNKPQAKIVWDTPALLHKGAIIIYLFIYYLHFFPSTFICHTSSPTECA